MPVPSPRASHPWRLWPALAAAAALLLASAPAQARPGVTVAEFNDATGKSYGERARTAIVRALADADSVELVPFAKVKTIAANRRIRPLDLAKPKILGKMSQIAGAETVVVGAVSRDLKIAVHIYDNLGNEIWAKTIPLTNGELPASTAQRFAAAITAAVGTKGIAVDKPGRPEPAPEPETDVPRATPTKTEPAEPKAPGPEDEPTSPIAAVSEPQRKPTDRRASEAEPAADEAGKPAEEELAKPGWVELSVDFTLTYRTYQFCPEVSDCSQTPPSGAGAPVKYSTSQPYGGFFLRADVYPLRFLDGSISRFFRGLGLSVGFGRSLFLKTHYTDDNQVDTVFGSTQQRFDVELVYRFYYRIDVMGDGWLGLRGGYLNHAFFVDPNPKIVESQRAGLYGEIEGALPLSKYVRLEVRAFLVPLASPGSVERGVYGAGDDANGRPTQGGGYGFEGGLTSDLGHPEWHIGLEVLGEYTHFADRYNNPPGTHPEFGRAIEDYAGLRFGLHGRL